MKKSLVGVVLGLVTVGGADASIVSRGFFEEQIGNYATLDLLNSKANQKDLTALNDIVGKENWDLVLNLKLGAFPYLSELFPGLAPDKGMPFEKISNYIIDNLTVSDTPNLAGVTDKFLYGWTNSDNLTRQGLIALNDGWTDKNDGTTYLGLKDINTKIGTLPSGKLFYGPALNILIGNLEYIYPNDLAGIYGFLFGSEENVGIIDMLSDKVVNGGPTPDIKGLRILTSDINEIAAKIGTVPDGKNLAGMIGTLPAGYDSVGAALEAINAKVDNKITNLSATASNGKYVLTAVKEGDQTTYAWESIDRSESENTQSVE